MNADELITRKDLKDFEQNLLKSLSELIKSEQPKKWLKSSEVRELLKISAGTLQNLRINGELKYSKIGGLIYYSYENLMEMLDTNKNNK